MNNKNKIVFITDALDCGGAQKMMSFVINTISFLFDEVHVILCSEKEVFYELPKNAFVHYCKCENNKKTLKVWNDIKTFLFIKRFLEQFVQNHAINTVCTFGYYYTSIAMMIKKKTGINIISSERRSPMDLKLFWRTVTKIVYKKCDYMVFQLDEVKNYYKMSKNANAFVIPNPYIPKTISNNPCKPSNRRKAIAIAAARLEFEKGFDIAIKAMSIVNKRYPDYCLEVYGEGDFEKMYRRIINRCNLQNVVSYKGLSKDIISDIFDASIFALPSRNEGIPNMLLEALGAGIPCVACDCNPGGAKMLLNSNQRGILVGKEDYKSLAEAIMKILADNSLSERLSNAAISVKDDFSLTSIEKKWIDVFKKTLIS